MHREQKKRITISISFLILLCSLIGVSDIHIVNGKSQWDLFFEPLLPHISIYGNGTISPAILPIERIGTLYYLTGDIYNLGISIDCDNIVLDGRNFSLKTNGSLNGEALSISAINVTIQNFVIDTVPVAVSLHGASGIMGENTETKILNNTIRNCNVAIECWGPSANFFKENTLVNNKIAIKIKGEAFSNGQYFSRGYACLNIVEKNIIKNNDEGLHIEDANRTTVRFNLIEQNQYGAFLNDVEGTAFTVNEFKTNTCGIHIIAPSSNNQFFQNNFDNNSVTVTLQVQTAIIMGKSGVINGLNETKNSWDNGKVGNYWSDYNGNGTYVISEDNIDRHPLCQPVDINSFARSELDNPTQNPIQTQTIIAIVILTVMAVAIATLLLFRKHRKITKLN
jgi:parallel beta-helix repeat protein